MPDLVYNESMSLACQWGRCQDCPEAGEPIDTCSCTCHIPDDTGDDDEADVMARAFYDRWCS